MSAIVDINQGTLQGKVALDYKGGNYFSFQGIPYAKPPVGDLRFKSPVPPENWKGVRNATKHANMSLSKHQLLRTKICGKEDCLYINVYTPQLPEEYKRNVLKPVMVFIHGGGFLMGSGNEDLYGPDYLVTGDVLLVTFNYRLGILGFLSLEDPELEVSGNMGLKDMVQALKWVQENISKFGGNPNNVTIFGESAGATACHLLILSPMAKGLFHRAILQSGCALNPWVYGSRIAKDIADVLGFNSNNERYILEFLRSIPESKFIEAQELIKDTFGCDTIRSISVVIEKHIAEPCFLTEHPIDIIKSGNYNKVPIILGYTNREGLITELSQKQDMGVLQMDTDLETRIPHYYDIRKGSNLAKTVASKIKEFYFQNRDMSEDNIDQFLMLETDVLFWRGIYVSVREHLKNLNLPIYLYRFSMDDSLNLYKRNACVPLSPGAGHADDIGYLFKTNFLPKFSLDSNVGYTVEKMVTLWTNFAKSSNPNFGGNPLVEVKWEAVLPGIYNYIDIGKTLTSGKNPDMERMKFWDEISSYPSINSKF